MKDAILTAITLCLSMFIIVMTIFILAKIGGFMFNDEAQAQTTMSAHVEESDMRTCITECGWEW